MLNLAKDDAEPCDSHSPVQLPPDSSDASNVQVILRRPVLQLSWLQS